MSRARDFILDEIDNRRDAGSEQSDYQREAELALEDYDALQAEVEALKAAVIAALGTYDTALSAATFTKPRTGQVILNVKTVERLNETLRAALKGAPHE